MAVANYQTIIFVFLFQQLRWCSSSKNVRIQPEATATKASTAPTAAPVQPPAPTATSEASAAAAIGS